MQPPRFRVLRVLCLAAALGGGIAVGLRVQNDAAQLVATLQAMLTFLGVALTVDYWRNIP